MNTVVVTCAPAFPQSRVFGNAPHPDHQNGSNLPKTSFCGIGSGFDQLGCLNEELPKLPRC